MICPHCAYEKTRVIATDGALIVKRWRKCLRCGRNFHTEEKALIEIDLPVRRRVVQ